MQTSSHETVRQPSLWDDQRMSMHDAIDLSIASLRAYGEQYEHWAIAYSGGKDSSATVSFVVWAIKTGQVTPPKSLTILYADTRQELPPLHGTAMAFMESLRADGFDARVVLPKLDDRFYVYMLGRGVPPPSNTFRWCTLQLKIEPMQEALDHLSREIDPIGYWTRYWLKWGMFAAILRGDYLLAIAAARALKGLPPRQKFLMITGVRLGESAARDARIAVSCSKDSGECGQGWFQHMPSDAISDTLAPLVHWRLCFVWDWLYFGSEDSYMQKVVKLDQPGHGYRQLADIAAVYGDEDARTGCIQCNLASRDVALENLISTPEWARLKPLTEIKPLFAELKKPQNRHRKAEPEVRKDGKYAKNGQRMGPLTMAARAYGLERMLDIQRRAGVNLINAEEEARIRQMWRDGVYPKGWTGTEVLADVPLDRITVIGNGLVVQPLLFAGDDQDES